MKFKIIFNITGLSMYLINLSSSSIQKYSSLTQQIDIAISQMLFYNCKLHLKMQYSNYNHTSSTNIILLNL